MGHEYVEMKNSHAAIEAYRKAVGMSFRYARVIVCHLANSDPFPSLSFTSFVFNDVAIGHSLQMLIEKIIVLGMVLDRRMNC